MKTLLKHQLAAICFAMVCMNAQSQTTDASRAELAKVWVGQWLDQTKDVSAALNVDAQGNFTFEKKRYAWVGSLSNMPKKAGCYALYEGVITKASLVQKAAPDGASESVLKKVSDDRFKQVNLTCLDAKGNKENSNDECENVGLFYDQKTIYRALNCKTGSAKYLIVYPFAKG